MKENEYILLKQSFPVSMYDRECDGYKFLIDNFDEDELKNMGINLDDLHSVIKENEKYLYRVGKENGKFKTMSISLHNFKIIRNKYMMFNDE